MVQAAAKCFAGGGAAARTGVPSQYFCAFRLFLFCTIGLRSGRVDLHRFAGSIFASEIDVLIVHSADVSAIGAATELRNHFS